MAQFYERDKHVAWYERRTRAVARSQTVVVASGQYETRHYYLFFVLNTTSVIVKYLKNKTVHVNFKIKQ